jgi:hypothetical protein
MRAATADETADHARDQRKHDGRTVHIAPETYDNFIHLSVAIVGSATDMIEEIGGLKMRRRRSDYDHHPGDMLDLRKALSKAVRALEAYDAMVAAGRKTSTSDEFRAAEKAVSQ